MRGLAGWLQRNVAIDFPRLLHQRQHCGSTTSASSFTLHSAHTSTIQPFMDSSLLEVGVDDGGHWRS